MSIFTALNRAYSCEDAFGARDCTSPAMRDAIREWFRLYYSREATEESDPCQQIAYTIVSKLTKTAFGEYQATGGDAFTQGLLTALDGVRKRAMQQALIGGEAWLKPLPGAGGFAFSVVSRDNVLVFGRDGSGAPTDIGTAERTAEGRSWYTLLERRTVDGRGYLTICNRLYRSQLPDSLGVPVSLRALARYEALPEAYTFPEPLGGLGLARLATPLENCVDGSRDAVSVYAPAVGLIHGIDRNEALLGGEFERAQSRIIASADLLRKGRDGRRRLADKLFVGIDDDPEAVGLTIFSPAIREQSFLARKRDYLRAAENIIGLKRGLLSEVEEVEKTAREITSSAGDYNLTILDFQSMWEAAVREAVRLCGPLGRLYRVSGAHDRAEEGLSIDWGNGILYDEEKTWADYLDMVARGLLKPEIALGWRFGMPTETEADLAVIRSKYMPALDRLAEGCIAVLTPGQIAALRDAAEKISEPVSEYLIGEIARRIAQAGQMTGTAAYEVWRLQQLGGSQRQLKRELRRRLQLSHRDIRRIFYESAQAGYELDVSRFPYVQALPFEQNAVLQQITAAAVELAEEDFSNIVQTIGFVNPYGKAEPLTRAYVTSCDFAFQQTVTGAVSYTQAVREATRHLAAKGVRVIDYDSGVHTSLEAAVRRNILGGLGLMQEKVSQAAHDQLGCDGWEITAHAMSAPDHEPIQGKQYSDGAYQALNNALRRRIGTLNCGHAAFPILLGVNRPQYTPEELERFRADNAKGVTVDGVHYTGYEATQMQRSLERAIRAQKRKIMVDEATGDKEKLAQDKTRLAVLHRQYQEFCKAANLRTQYERTEAAGFGEKRSLANSTRSGIMEAVKPKETPDVKRALTQTDVTGEYQGIALPGQGVIAYEDGYEIKTHRDEIKMAEWLHRTFGGDIQLLKESKEPGDKTPDFRWNGRSWELKGISSKNSVDRAVREAAKQIGGCPGGIILQASSSELPVDMIESAVEGRVRRIALDSVDVMIVSGEDLKKIVRYKK